MASRSDNDASCVGCGRKSRTAAALRILIGLIAFSQLLAIVLTTRLLGVDVSSSSHPIAQWRNEGTGDKGFIEDAITEYPCFPPRRVSSHPANDNGSRAIVYLETAYVYMHYETFYTFIHQICSCSDEKDPRWSIDTREIPHFYIGPWEMLTVGFEDVLREYNTTTCGPLFFGKPPVEPSLTIVTTAYPTNFAIDDPKQYHKLIGDPRYIFICHEDAPFLENATNVFFLTPSHNRYVVPSFFPPSIVRRHSKSLRERHPGRPPLFLVMGGWNNRYRRNVPSLLEPLRIHRDKNFTVRFLGGTSGSASNEHLTKLLQSNFPEDNDKVELLLRTDTDDFMVRAAEADVILPLVDSGNFFDSSGYQGGKKLTSSVMWGLGFRKKMVLYSKLAELFGIEENNTTIFVYGESTAHFQAFPEAFGRCLHYLMSQSTGDA